MTAPLKRLEAAPTGATLDAAEFLASLRWNKAGLIPAIAQDAESREVLMLAWMNEDALRETLATGRACYWSRSRAALWRKGESSGHAQQVREVRIDCDGDTILLLVDQTGPACHTGATPLLLSAPRRARRGGDAGRGRRSEQRLRHGLSSAILRAHEHPRFHCCRPRAAMSRRRPDLRVPTSPRGRRPVADSCEQTEAEP